MNLFLFLQSRLGDVLLLRFPPDTPKRNIAAREIILIDNFKTMFLVKRYGFGVGGIQITGQEGGIGPVQDGLDESAPETLSLVGRRHGENKKIPVGLSDILAVYSGEVDHCLDKAT